MLPLVSSMTSCVSGAWPDPRAALRGANGEHHAVLCTRRVDDKQCSEACGVTRCGVHTHAHACLSYLFCFGGVWGGGADGELFVKPLDMVTELVWAGDKTNPRSKTVFVRFSTQTPPTQAKVSGRPAKVSGSRV